MVKTLTKHGNSYALIIDKPILELLRIEPDSPLEVSTDGKVLTITPVSPESRGARVGKSLARINARHGKALRKLAE
ncbi:MAG: AbrB/MazE/SpoVT family DNA-binding domain-containing protein [Phycisphaeraceae bacterium]|jgi:antitoxin MazE|nr:AbrB/MazE/SpoVT family DNA-binding domain-containing protein [Phycisphaerales bacterium]QOJ18462.1 MAG: AbrB/MazE/SpoVT family DNA-binding domain-containing protein [Phycisphaeraceae bacterium]